MAVAGAAKLRKTTADVDAFLEAIPDPQRRADAGELVDPDGGDHRRAARDLDSEHRRLRRGPLPVPERPRRVIALAAFAPRKDSLVIYLVGGYQERYPKLLAQLGPHRTGKSCLYVKRLGDVDAGVLRRLVERSVEAARGMDRAVTRSQQQA